MPSYRLLPFWVIILGSLAYILVEMQGGAATQRFPGGSRVAAFGAKRPLGDAGVSDCLATTPVIQRGDSFVQI